MRNFKQKVEMHDDETNMLLLWILSVFKTLSSIHLYLEIRGCLDIILSWLSRETYTSPSLGPNLENKIFSKNTRQGLEPTKFVGLVSIFVEPIKQGTYSSFFPALL